MGTGDGTRRHLVEIVKIASTVMRSLMKIITIRTIGCLCATRVRASQRQSTITEFIIFIIAEISSRFHVPVVAMLKRSFVQILKLHSVSEPSKMETIPMSVRCECLQFRIQRVFTVQ